MRCNSNIKCHFDKAIRKKPGRTQSFKTTHKKMRQTPIRQNDVQRIGADSVRLGDIQEATANPCPTKRHTGKHDKSRPLNQRPKNFRKSLPFKTTHKKPMSSPRLSPLAKIRKRKLPKSEKTKKVQPQSSVRLNASKTTAADTMAAVIYSLLLFIILRLLIIPHG